MYVVGFSHECIGTTGVSTGYTTTSGTSGYNMGLRVCNSCGVGYATGTGHVCAQRCHLHFSVLPCAWCRLPGEFAKPIGNTEVHGFGESDYRYIPTITKTTVCEECGEYSEWTHACIEPDWKKELRPYMSQQEEPLANNIDEQQITLLDGMRSARDAAYRYAQSKHDRATLMRIQADALEAEGNEIVSEINEGVPAPESE